MKIRCILPIPISTNKGYKLSRTSMYMTPEGNNYKMTVMLLVRNAIQLHNFLVSEHLGWDMVVIPPNRRSDVDGGIKFTQDAIADSLGINDKRFSELGHVIRTSPSVKYARTIVHIYNTIEHDYREYLLEGEYE